MVKTRSSISPSHSVKIAADKKNMENVSDDGDRDDSDRSGGSGGSSDGSRGSALQTKRKRVVEKVKKEDVRNVKKMKQVAEDLPQDYDSEDLEVEVRNDLKVMFKFIVFDGLLLLVMFKFIEWDLYFKPGEKIQGKVMLFPNQDNIVVKNINSKLTKDQHSHPVGFQSQLVHNALHRETVTVSAVEHRFMYSDFKSDEYAVKMAVLYLVTNCLTSSVYSKKVPVEILNIIGVDEYGSFPWGIPKNSVGIRKTPSTRGPRGAPPGFEADGPPTRRELAEGTAVFARIVRATATTFCCCTCSSEQSDLREAPWLRSKRKQELFSSLWWTKTDRPPGFNAPSSFHIDRAPSRAPKSKVSIIIESHSDSGLVITGIISVNV
ncbi:hypothetical protein F8388_008091 [Cannabis sativa]|uniref:DUF1985 domain-containing protein n=1 Tax=Cannabis sativa TaxID=3483 RepID=A0A7J6EAS9_CANSA|nr:hypothetical protein F8388_008091 [Cannabis sativa]